MSLRVCGDLTMCSLTHEGGALDLIAVKVLRENADHERVECVLLIIHPAIA